jgi:hypothetical protein
LFPVENCGINKFVKYHPLNLNFAPPLDPEEANIRTVDAIKAKPLAAAVLLLFPVIWKHKQLVALQYNHLRGIT